MATAKWLGTASLELKHNGKVLLIDPHLSRPNKWETFTQPLAPKADKIDAYLDTIEGEVIGILITHSHSDHLSDTPYIAKKLGVHVWGNESADTAMKIYGLPGCPLVLKGGEKFKIGPFTIEPVKTRHGNVALGRVPFPGRISPDAKPPLYAWQFKHGEPPLVVFVTAGKRTLYHQGTANLIDNLIPIREIGSAWICASGYKYTPDFPKRIMRRLHPEKVIPFHFEDFSKPLSENTSLIPGSDPHEFGKKIQAVAPDVEIRVPKPYEVIPF